MNHKSTRVRVAALAGAAALALAACGNGGGGSSDEALVIGTLLPQTGSLAFLGPPEIAGVDLAVKEINEAGGVLGQPVVVHHADSSDADNAQVSQQSVTQLKSKGVQAIVGAASSAVTRLVVDDITNSQIIQISPANTATDLSGKHDFYFRTAPSDLLQGAALGNLILSDGHQNVGVLVFNEDYGTSLRDVLKRTIEEAGGTITYGNPGEEFDPTLSSFADPATAVLATNPDAIAIIAFDQTKTIVPELVSRGFDGSKLYFVDGSLADYSQDFEPGTLAGAKGTLPGAFANDAFKERLFTVDDDLKEFAYAAESYDAVMLVALAAVKAKSVKAVDFQKEMAAVSGANGGTKCTGFKECAELLAKGEEIDYEAISGAGPFNENNDPSSALIGIYQFGEDNTYSPLQTIAGEL